MAEETPGENPPSNIKEKLEHFLLLRDEQARMIKTLLYYEWLGDHALAWDMISAVTQPFPWSEATRAEAKRWYRQNDLPLDELKAEFARPYSEAIAYKLKDGREVVLPAPPFSKNVVFNKSLLEKCKEEG